MLILQVTDKIRLEMLNISMAQIIFDTISRDRRYLNVWLPFVSMTRTISDTEMFINSVVGQKGIKKDEVYGIYYENKFAGLIGFKDTDWVNQKTELGYWLAERMQGKGIVTQSVNYLINYAFDKHKMNRVQLKIAVGNNKSAAIARRLEFILEGVEREGEKHGSRYLDLEVYSMLRKDWKRQ